MPSPPNWIAPPTPNAQNASSSKSFFSRIKAPFNSKSRNFTEFEIRLNDPHKRYSPGDIVSGSVHLRVLRPVRVTHIAVCLHGYAQVFKNPNSPGDPLRSVSTGGTLQGNRKRSAEYWGNGFASLFEDESVLCGEGRLDEGPYLFDFELEFPREGLPSSIDFERGTVTYMITATLTRPTTISPTTTTEAKVHFVETIDIAPILPPKPRVITLRPVSRRSRVKGGSKKLTSSTIDSRSKASGASTPEPVKTDQASTLYSIHGDSEPPPTPAPSELSFDSVASSGARASIPESGRTSIAASDSNSSGNGTTSKSSGSDKVITTTIELIRSGCLPGDQITVKVGVQHTKRLQSLHGIIVTMYRQARVDWHPALPLGPTGSTDKPKYEDYYPKSKTGLGGLSLSAAGSSHAFRKEIAQSTCPLIIDPRTLTAEAKASLWVPDELFPTITNVPGAMISFKYYIEVVLDIQGKMVGLDRHQLPSLGMVNLPMAYVNGRSFVKPEDFDAQAQPTWQGTFIDTQAIRRDKTVVACVFPIVVGTRDSDRKKGKQRQEVLSEPEEMPEQYPTGHGEEQGYDGYDYHDYGAGHDWDGYDPNDPNYHHYDPNYHGGYYYDPSYQDGMYGPPGTGHFPIPLPVMEEEDQLPEKERLRRAEERLLPSQPPTDDAPEPSSSGAAMTPTAPVLDELEHVSTPTPQASRSTTQPYPAEAPGPSAPPLHLLTNGNFGDDHTPAPEYSHHEKSASTARATEDKQELQRRRLEMERSAPDDFPDDEVGPSAPPHFIPLPPSAPILNEEEEEELAYRLGGASLAPPTPGERRNREYEGFIANAGPSHAPDDSSRGRRETLPAYER